jgi:hypothetical protein
MRKHEDRSRHLMMARPNAAQWRTHIRRRNRKRSDDAVAIVRSDVAAIRALAIWSL